MPTNTNVTPKATPHMDPDAPIFDATPQIKVCLKPLVFFLYSYQQFTKFVIHLYHHCQSTGGVQQAAETDLPDSGPCFDQTPSEHVSSVIYIFFVVVKTVHRFCTVMLHSITSLCIIQISVMHICTYMYAKQMCIQFLHNCQLLMINYTYIYARLHSYL